MFVPEAIPASLSPYPHFWSFLISDMHLLMPELCCQGQNCIAVAIAAVLRPKIALLKPDLHCWGPICIAEARSALLRPDLPPQGQICLWGLTYIYEARSASLRPNLQPGGQICNFEATSAFLKLVFFPNESVPEHCGWLNIWSDQTNRFQTLPVFLSGFK